MPNSRFGESTAALASRCKRDSSMSHEIMSIGKTNDLLPSFQYINLEKDNSDVGKKRQTQLKFCALYLKEESQQQIKSRWFCQWMKWAVKYWLQSLAHSHGAIRAWQLGRNYSAVHTRAEHWQRLKRSFWLVPGFKKMKVEILVRNQRQAACWFQPNKQYTTSTGQVLVANICCH